MKKVIKFAFVLISLVFAQQAFAACWSNANQVPHGTPPLFLQNGLFCTTQQPQGVQVLQSSAVYLPSGGQAPQGYCSWSDRVANIGISTLIGGFLGALATDTSRGAGQGAALGGAAGMFIPCAQTHVAQVPTTIVNQGVQSGQPATVNVASSCSIEGKLALQNMRGLTDANCAAIAELAGSKTVTSSSSSLVFSNEGTGTGVCRLRSNGFARLKSNPNQKLAEGTVLAVDQATSDSGSATVISKNPSEDCTTWRHRVAEQIVSK